MTREEAIELKAAAGRLMYSDNKDIRDYNMLIDFIESTLRPISQERVKKVWESKWIPLDSTQEHYCRECGVSFNLYSYCKNDYNFCPYCGCAMTPDALEIVKSNLEAISRED